MLLQNRRSEDEEVAANADELGGIIMNRLKLIHNQVGTTMVEVLVSLVIVGICGSAFLYGMTNVTKTTPMVDDRITCLALAENQMESIRNQHWRSDFPGDAYEVIDEIKDSPYYSVGTPFVTNRWTGLQKLVVRVKVPSSTGGDDIVVVLEEYRAR